MMDIDFKNLQSININVYRKPDDWDSQYSWDEDPRMNVEVNLETIDGHKAESKGCDATVKDNRKGIIDRAIEITLRKAYNKLELENKNA